ncbi:hypothetical protein [Terriglobus sp.]|uniref:hypothetical protein n=1 Tax=Terriglobus sp. TaxID=1889013 RepID=UPI003AFF7F4F
MAEGHDSKQAREAFEAAERTKNSAIPGAEQGDHAKSHAAHLEVEGNVHTTPEGHAHQAREPGALREPPQDPQRVGETFRRQ